MVSISQDFYIVRDELVAEHEKHHSLDQSQREAHIGASVAAQ